MINLRDQSSSSGYVNYLTATKSQKKNFPTSKFISGKETDLLNQLFIESLNESMERLQDYKKNIKDLNKNIQDIKEATKPTKKPKDPEKKVDVLSITSQSNYEQPFTKEATSEIINDDSDLSAKEPLDLEIKVEESSFLSQSNTEPLSANEATSKIINDDADLSAKGPLDLEIKVEDSSITSQSIIELPSSNEVTSKEISNIPTKRWWDPRPPEFYTKLRIETEFTNKSNKIISNNEKLLRNYKNKAKNIKKRINLTQIIQATTIDHKSVDIDTSFKKQDKIAIIKQSAEKVLNLSKNEKCNFIKFNRIIDEAEYNMELLDSEEKSLLQTKESYKHFMNIFEGALNKHKEILAFNKQTLEFENAENLDVRTMRKIHKLEEVIERIDQLYEKYFPISIPKIEPLTSELIIDLLKNIYEQQSNLAMFAKYVGIDFSHGRGILRYIGLLSTAMKRAITNVEDALINCNYIDEKSKELDKIRAKDLYETKKSELKKLKEIHKKFAKISLDPQPIYYNNTYFNYSIIREINIAEESISQYYYSNKLIDKIINNFNNKISIIKKEQEERDKVFKKFNEIKQKYEKKIMKINEATTDEKILSDYLELDSFKLPEHFELQETKTYIDDLNNIISIFNEKRNKLDQFLSESKKKRNT